MSLAVTETAIDGLLEIKLKEGADGRGCVREFFRGSSYEALGLGSWQQINATQTCQGAIRGMHAEEMTKLVGVVAGEAFGAWFDLRANSPTRGSLYSRPLVPGIQVLVPSGVLNGFQSVSREDSIYFYCFDAEWSPGMSGSACNPLSAPFQWPLPVDWQNRSQISEKDANLPSLEEIMKP